VNGESTVIAGAGFQLAEESKKEIPGVENATRIQRIGKQIFLTRKTLLTFSRKQ
jgi:hypothetical protein